MRKVTPEEIDLLHAFVKSRFVEFYDVELEMVDHLSNGIEAQWMTNPHLSFEQAKQIEFKKFGIFGFVGVVEQKQSELTSIYLEEMTQELKSFFTVPKVVFTLAIFLLLFLVGYKGGELGQNSLVALFAVLLIGYFGIGAHWSYSLKKKRKKNRRIILDSVALKVFFGGALMPLFCNFPQLLNVGMRGDSIVGLLFLCALILFLGLWSYIVVFIFKPYFTQILNRMSIAYV